MNSLVYWQTFLSTRGTPVFPLALRNRELNPYCSALYCIVLHCTALHGCASQLSRRLQLSVLNYCAKPDKYDSTFIFHSWRSTLTFSCHASPGSCLHHFCPVFYIPNLSHVLLFDHVSTVEKLQIIKPHVTQFSIAFHHFAPVDPILPLRWDTNKAYQ
jgi:hypothetical protein